MIPGTRGDGLRLQLAGDDVIALAAIALGNGLAGVVVLKAAAANGPGTGQIAVIPGINPARLTWQAPGSSTPGRAINVPPLAGSLFLDALLEDGESPAAFVVLRIYPALLPSSGMAIIQLRDRYNELGPADVAAADAAAGLVTATTYTLKNVSPALIAGVKLWIDATVSGISVSSDGVNFYTPTSSTDAHVLTWSSIAPGAAVNLYVKRTIAAAAVSNPAILNWLHYSWTGV